MRFATLVLLLVVLAGIAPLTSIDATAPGDAVNGYALFGDLTKEEAAKKARHMAETDFRAEDLSDLRCRNAVRKDRS